MFSYDISGKNKYYTLYSKIREDILSGRLKAGERLVGKRTLARELGVSVITVQTAYEQLNAEGYIKGVERSGYFVSELDIDYYGEKNAYALPPDKPKKMSCIDFVGGSTPAELFPFSSWAKLMREVLSECGKHLLERVPCDGDAELKTAISGYLYRARGMSVDPRCIVIGAGAEYLYGVVVQLLGRDKLYALENPCYKNIYETYALNGAKCVFAEVHKDGIDCSQFETSDADVLHISPSHQFPTGAVTPAYSRARLINAALRRGGYIVEDDYDSEFRLSGKPLQTMYGLCPDRVIYINTFSKTLAPSMRMGYMVLPAALYSKYLKLFGSNANVVPLFEQKALARMINSGAFERHINRLKNYYRGVRSSLIEKLSEGGGAYEISDTGSGLHFTVKINSAPSDEYIKKRALKKGIEVKCLSDYLLAPAFGYEKTVVINYSGITAEVVSGLNGDKILSLGN